MLCTRLRTGNQFWDEYKQTFLLKRIFLKGLIMRPEVDGRAFKRVCVNIVRCYF